MSELKSSVELSEKKAMWILLSMPVILSIAYGIDTWQFITYNAFATEGMEDASLRGYLPLDHLRNFGLAGLFLKYFRFLHLNPAAYFATSLAVSCAVFLLIFRMARLLMERVEESLALTLFFLLAALFGSHGDVSNGMWGAPVFYKASISAVCTLSAVYLTLRGRYYIASFLFAASIHLHPLYGFSAFAFFSAGFAYHLWRNHGEHNLKGLVAPVLFVFANLIFLAVGSSGGELQGARLSIAEWYAFCYKSNPDDMSLLYSFANHGYALFPLLVVALHVALKKENRGLASDMVVGGSVLIAAVLLVEILHACGMFLPVFSEKFIPLSLRRGTWVVYFFAFALILRHFLSSQVLSRRKDAFLFLLFLSVYLRPGIITVGILVLAVVLLLRDHKAIVLLSVFLGALALKYGLVGFKFALSSRDVIFVAVSMAFVHVFYTMRKGDDNRVVMVPVVVFLCMALAFGIIGNRLPRSLSIIGNNGLFAYPDYRRLIGSLKETNKNAQKVYDFGLYDALKKANAEKGIVLFPPYEVEFELSFLGAPPFLTSLDFDTARYSKRYYEYLMYRVGELLGEKNPQRIFQFPKYINEDLTFREVNERYLEIGPEHLSHLAQKFGIRFFVTTRNYEGLRLLYRSDRYYLYDLGPQI